MTASKPIYEFDEWRLDPNERLLLSKGEAVSLTPKVFETLLVLVENAGRLVPKSEFMKRVWPNTFVEDVALAQNISHLRKVLAKSGETNAVIETVSKGGYRFLRSVRVVPADKTSTNAATHPDSTVPTLTTNDKEEGADLRRADSVRSKWKLAPVPAAVALTVLAMAVVMFGFAGLHRVRVARAAGLTSGRFAPTGVIEAATAKITPLITLPGEESMPVFSPDGSRVAFVWQSPQRNKSGIYVAVVGSESILRLSTDGGDVCPTWSPDGRQVAFLRHRGDQFSIQLVSALGGTERRVYAGTRVPWVGPEGISFSPDSKRIAYAEWDAESRQSAIKQITLEDSTVRQLTSPPMGYHDAAPAFAPDGQSFAFVRSTGPIFLDEVYVARLSGGAPLQLTFDRHRVFGAPVWTADSRDLLFSSNRAGLKSLWRISASGGQPQPVLGPGPVADHPSISAATGELAYETSVEDENLWRLDSQKRDSQPTSLFSSKTSNLMPQFSPDGSKIAFEGDRSGYEEIWICERNGSNAEQVTKLERFSGSPRWSPDGRRLVFDSRREEHSGIYIVDIVDGSVKPVETFADSDSVVPNWSRDGRRIYFASNHGGSTFHVWQVPAEGGTPVLVTKSEGFAAIESPDGKEVFYSKLSGRGIWKVSAQGGSGAPVTPGLEPDNWANWAVTKDAIYFIESPPHANAVIKRFDRTTQRVSKISVLARPSFYGLTLSADGGDLIYSERDRDEHDILVTRLFR